MIPIDQYLQEIEIDTNQKKVLYPRQELIKKFVDEINGPRIGSGYRPLSPAFIASKMYTSLQHYDKSNYERLLTWFYGYCKDSKNFSKCWWWSLKSK